MSQNKYAGISKKQKALKSETPKPRKNKKGKKKEDKAMENKTITKLTTATETAEPVREDDLVKVYYSGDVAIVKYDDTPRNRKFEKLVTKSEEDLKAYLSDYFVKEGKAVIEGEGYLYIDGDFPVLLTAHLDTVHKELPKQIVYERGAISSPQGIGGDDRCGVYAIMRILKEIDCPVVFCEQEEIGGVGSDLFTTSDVFKELVEINKIKYVIDLDRKGKNDAVYYSLDNKDFENFIQTEFWKKDFGSFTDICNICPDLGVAGVNLSVGYYNQHTLGEYVVLADLEKAIEETKALIKRTDPNTDFEYKELKYYSYGYGCFSKLSSRYDDWWEDDDGYGSWYNNTKKEKVSLTPEYYYISYYGTSGEEVTFIEAISEVEAIGQFLIDNPDLTYKDIFDFGLEDDYNWSIGGGYGDDKYGYNSVTV